MSEVQAEGYHGSLTQPLQGLDTQESNILTIFLIRQAEARKRKFDEGVRALQSIGTIAKRSAEVVI
jgi:hypothetical protein